ncbi:MAG: flagellar assembly protein FliH [Peptococcaceae bacterium]|nr:flagellar assembly protein FliH [Peptococcaceae bacterium]
MKLSTRNTVIKSTVVEIASPRLVKSNKESRGCFSGNYTTQETSVLMAEPALKACKQSQENNELEIVSKAAARADEIIAEARQKAEEIILEAQRENEARREEYLTQLRNEIFSQAHDEGYNQGLKEAKEKAEQICKQAKAYLEMAQRVLKQEFDKVDGHLVALCLKICDQILHTALNVDQEKLLNLIRKLTLMPQNKEGIKIHMSAKDWEWYKTIPDEDKPSYAVIVNESLSAGNVFLECEEGAFDASLESQLDKIGNYLLEEFQRARLDDFSSEN